MLWEYISIRLFVLSIVFFIFFFLFFTCKSPAFRHGYPLGRQLIKLRLGDERIGRAAGFGRLAAIAAVPENVEPMIHDLKVLRKIGHMLHRAKFKGNRLLALHTDQMMMMVRSAAGAKFQSFVQINLLQYAHFA